MRVSRSPWLVAVFAVLALAGCAPPQPVVPPAPTLSLSPDGSPPEDVERAVPPFPALTEQLRLDGVEACALLSPDQAAELGVDPAGNNTAYLSTPGQDCNWSPRQPNTGNRWQIKLATQGIQPTIPSPAPIDLVPVERFTAARMLIGGIPTVNCALVVKVADNQFLFVSYLGEPEKYPPAQASIQRACDTAIRSAAMMITTLRGLSR